jgi:hypothetical protein
VAHAATTTQSSPICAQQQASVHSASRRHVTLFVHLYPRSAKPPSCAIIPCVTRGRMVLAVVCASTPEKCLWIRQWSYSRTVILTAWSSIMKQPLRCLPLIYARVSVCMWAVARVCTKYHLCTHVYLCVHLCVFLHINSICMCTYIICELLFEAKYIKWMECALNGMCWCGWNVLVWMECAGVDGMCTSYFRSVHMGTPRLLPRCGHFWACSLAQLLPDRPQGQEPWYVNSCTEKSEYLHIYSVWQCTCL